MNEQSFNNELVKIAPDMRLLYDARMKLWGVFQIRSSTIIVPTGADRPFLLWHVTNDDGTFRLPDRRDLDRAAKSAASAHVGWRKGGDWYMDKIEAQEEARAEKRREASKDLVHQAAHEVRFHNGVVTNPRSR